jgi:formylglycine-generating enzyme required for sulfatase activity/dienelactone hydrolase
MLAGRKAFSGDNTAAVLHAVLTGEPPKLATIRPDVPPDVAAIVERAIEKDRERRFASARDMRDALAASELALRAPAATSSSLPTRARRRVLIPLAVIVALLLGAAVWTIVKSRRETKAREQTLPEIARLAQQRQFSEAFRLAERAEHVLGAAAVADVWPRISAAVTIETSPPGAAAEIREYADQTAAWQALGTTPIANRRLPLGTFRWRFSKEGHETVERAGSSEAGTIEVPLPPRGEVPPGMVKVAAGKHMLIVGALGLPRELDLPPYFLDRHEVTNREFKAFVDAGGYRRREFWTEAFIDGERELSWDDAVARFRDTTSQPGPAGWEAGAYPAGEDDLPVRGVSWYEAAAYAAFAGKSLPTVNHWYGAAGVTASPYVLPLANFAGRGPARVGSSGAISPSGAYDMAGNVKEWCSNASGALRYALGGAFGEPQYMFGDAEALAPFDRGAANGFRCAKYIGELDPRWAAPMPRVARNLEVERPVSDETFRAFERAHAYDPAPSRARVERTIEDHAEWRTERVTIAAAYGGERVVVYLWLPKQGKPPYQTVIIFPGAEALRLRDSTQLEAPGPYDFLVRSGRAVVHPVYYGMHERAKPRPQTPLAIRDFSIRWGQDLRRTMDYLGERTDIDSSRLAYFGTSLGAWFGPIPIALDQRLRVAVLIGGGLTTWGALPEVETMNFAPRVRVPTLLLNGRYDFLYPLAESQRPFFDLLGTPPAMKSHVLVEAGHSVPRRDYVREALAWLDQHLGAAR